MSEQPALFELPPAELSAAAHPAQLAALARALPESVRLGTMSWTYPGWKDLVYAEEHSPKLLADLGLTAYRKHPLLRAVEIDRSFYEPLGAAVYQRYAAQVPADFRFVVKAHEECTLHRFPALARHGKRAGERNDRYLDPTYAAEQIVLPLLESAGAQVFALLFQFSPAEEDERPAAFAERLQRFLAALPSAPFAYAVELRTRARLTAHYGQALQSVGAIHCHNVWTHMPDILTQARALPAASRRPLLIRWLLREHDDYRAASARSAPFQRIVSPDPENLARVTRLVQGAIQHNVPALIAIDNKAEGSAPLTALRLAESLTRA